MVERIMPSWAASLDMPLTECWQSGPLSALKT
jgi:hypothetical protein